MQEVRTGRLVTIRPFHPNDIRPFFQAAQESIGEVGVWLPWCHPEYSLSDSEGWVLSRDAAWIDQSEFSFVVLERESGHIVGGVGLNGVDRSNAHVMNLGYWTRSASTGRGYATEAARLAVEFGFAELELQRIEILVAVDNRASIRVAEHLGGVREGILRNRLKLGATLHDAVMFSLLPTDRLPRID